MKTVRLELRLAPEDERILGRLCELERLGRADVVRRALYFRLQELEPELAALRSTDARVLTEVRGELRREASRGKGDAGRRVPVYMVDADTVSPDSSAGPPIGEAFIPERIVELDDQVPNPSPLMDARAKPAASRMAETKEERLALLKKVAATGTLRTADELEAVEAPWGVKEEE